LSTGGAVVLVSDIPALRDFWYPVAYAAEVSPGPRAVRLFGEQLAVWRGQSGSLAAAVDLCPHRGGRLSQGWVVGDCLTCPYHGWRYDRDGRCVEIPANDPGLPVPSRARVATAHAAERYGLVWMCIGTAPTSIPTLPECEGDDYIVIHELMEEWHASAPRIIDNGLDVSHVAFVHRKSVGTDSAPRMADVDVERDGINIRFSATYTTRVNEQQRANTGIEAGFTTRSTHGELVQPFVFRGVLEYHETGLRHVLFKTATPIDDERTLFCQFVARNDNPDAERIEGIVALDRMVQAEDKELLEAIAADFPLDVHSEIHTKADRMTLEYRRALAELASDTATEGLARV
jgi:phenylpropionate dioxygenase-like ring-hydroxylating dioxygenase large terminal subunit